MLTEAWRKLDIKTHTLQSVPEMGMGREGGGRGAEGQGGGRASVFREIVRREQRKSHRLQLSEN